METAAEEKAVEQNDEMVVANTENDQVETENEIMDPLEVNKHPKIIKDAQYDLGKLDILVCGQCHTVFHFIEHFQEHRLMGKCCGVSSIRENNINETKAQVWAFLLWKGAQNIDENENSWVVYQRWCKLDSHIKEAWITAGRNVQVFTKLSAAKMQEVRATVQPIKKNSDDPLEEGEIKMPTQGNKKKQETDPLDTDDPLDTESELDTEEEAEREAELENLKKLRANLNKNGTVDSGSDNTKKDENAEKKVVNNTSTPVVKKIIVPLDKGSRIAKRTDKLTSTEKECTVEKILAKRFNPRRKLHEYLIKWDGFTHDLNTWEPASNLETCKQLLEIFERNLAKQKEQKAAAAAAQAQLAKQQQKQKPTQPGTSGILTTPGGRPQRTSKQKALSQVKQWCGNIVDRDDDLKHDSSDSDDDMDEKRIKLELDSGSEDEWTGEAPEPERTGMPGRPRILSKAANTVNGVAKKMTANDVAKSIGLASPDRSEPPPLVPTPKQQIVKVFNRSQTNLPSGVYMVNSKDGTLTTGKLGTSIVRVVQKTVGPGGQQVVRVAPKTVGNTQVRVIQKGGDNIVRLSPGMMRPGLSPKMVTPKGIGAVKTVVRPAVRVVQGEKKLTPQKMTIGTPQIKVTQKGRGVPVAKATPVVLAPDPVEKDSDSSDDDFDPFPTDLPPPAPDSPPREFTLDPLTGLIVGQAEGEPEPSMEEPEPLKDTPKVTLMPSLSTPMITDTPNMGASEKIMETGTIVVPGPSMPDPESILPDITPMETDSEQAATISLPETDGEPLMVAGEDGVIYRVAGQNEDGQTLLIAQNADGDQQCVYVTSAAVEDQVQQGEPHPTTSGESANVLTLDGAVAEAVQDSEAATEPLTVETAEISEGSGDNDPNAQVVAQLVRADLPSPGGTRKVVFLLPDGNYLVTDVDAEQFSALELDK